MPINLALIKTFNPCSNGLNNYIKYYKKFNGTVQEFLQLEHIPYGDKIWLVSRIVKIDILVQWSVDCAEFVLENYEKQSPNDSRIKDCIEMTKKFILGEASLEELKIAKSAARSAESDAWSAARFAARSARSAESDARSARSAESAARSAWSAAKSAAESAWSAAKSAAESAAESAAKSDAWSDAEKSQENINLSLLIALL